MDIGQQPINGHLPDDAILGEILHLSGSISLPHSFRSKVPVFGICLCLHAPADGPAIETMGATALPLFFALTVSFQRPLQIWD